MNPSTATRTGVRLLVLVAVLLAVMSLLGAPRLATAQSAEGDEQPIRTQVSGIGGFTVNAVAAPMAILFYEPTFPIPTDPGQPHMEVTESHTHADLSTGPRARAVGSSVWPGAGISGGWPQFANGEQYPFMVEATYPGGQQEAQQEIPNGPGMEAVARGLDVRADARSQGTPAPELATFGNVSSTSISTVTDDGVAVSRSDASVQGVALLEGLITIDSLRTQLEATSDGKKGTTSGSTTVNGLTIAGNGYVVDQGGVRPVQEGKPGEGIAPVPSALPGAEELRKQLGIEVQPVLHEEELEGSRAVRRAGGVKITVDTKVMKQALNELPIGEIVEMAPDELKAHLYPILGLGPKIEFVFGRGRVLSTTSLPLDLNLDIDVDIPPPAVAPPPTTTTSTGESGFSTAPGGTTSAPSVGTDSTPPSQTAPEQPQTAAPADVPGQPILFQGLSPLLVLLAAGLAGAAGYGLQRATSLIMPGGAASGMCADGHVKAVPDL